MKKTSAISLLAILSTMALFPALAAPIHATSVCQVTQADVSPPVGSAQVIHVVYSVTNDEDSGLVGYWALDSYTKTVTIWEGPTPGNFYAAVFYTGSFQTFKGALSPENGVIQAYAGSGSMTGGYIATFTGTFNGNASTYAGAHDFGGAVSDILLGTYGNGQTGSPHRFNIFNDYFTAFAGFTTQSPWGWLYQYNNQSWCNSESVNSGDIITQAPPPVPPIPPSAMPPILNLTTYGNVSISGNFVGMVGPRQVEYNFPKVWNSTLFIQDIISSNSSKQSQAWNIFPVAFNYCINGNGNLRVSGFSTAWFGGSPLNATQIIFGDYESFITSAQGWPAEPACSA